MEALRKELYEAAGLSRCFHVIAEDVKHLLPDWKDADGSIATNRIMVEDCKIGYCYRENPDGDWDRGWRFTVGDESDAYMDDPQQCWDLQSKYHLQRRPQHYPPAEHPRPLRL